MRRRITLHPAWTYMLRDIAGSAWGTLVFSAALLAPGFCFGWWTNFFRFRSLGAAERVAWSIAFSLGVGTLPLVLLVWIAGLWAAAGLLLLCSLATVWLIVRERNATNSSWQPSKQCIWLLFVWAATVIGSLVDIGIGSRLWMSVTAYDHTLRTAFVDAVMRTGVPPINPAYWPGHGAPMRYYYFWYVICAAVATLAHISARQALIASCVWSMFGVAAMLFLFGRYMLGWKDEKLRQQWWLAIALLAVTGLDGLVMLFVWLTGDFIPGDLEWWALDQVTSWVDTFLWVPHHAAALVCCLLCVLLLWMASTGSSIRAGLPLIAVAAISFSSAFGLSTYIAAATAMVLLAWVVWRLFHADRAAVASSTGLMALIAFCALGPYLLQLLQNQTGSAAASGHVLGFGIRKILYPDTLYGMPGIHALLAVHPHLAEIVSELLLLAPGYGVELGFFAVVLIAAQKLRHKSPGETTLLFFTWAGLAVASFVRSQVIATNDFAIRASLLPQFMLLLLGVQVWQRSSVWLRRTLAGLAIIGVCGVAYQLAALRTYLAWHELHGDPGAYDLAERNYALRDAYAALQAKAPAFARVQFSVREGANFSYPTLLHAGRQVITDTSACNVSFGGELAPCGSIQHAVQQLFPAKADETPSAAEAISLCRSMGADYLIATRWDPAWATHNGWVWTLSAAVQRPAVRIVACSALSHSGTP